MTKMPVPMIAPMPSAVRSSTPTARLQPVVVRPSRGRGAPSACGRTARGASRSPSTQPPRQRDAGPPIARTRARLERRTAGACTVPSARAATFKGRARVSPRSDLHARRRPAAGHRRGRRGAVRRGPDGHAPGRHRHRQDDDDGGHHRARPAPDARHGAQQDARRAALQRVPDVLPRQRGRVLRLLLRLLPARGLRPEQGPLHREGLGDQPGGRPPAPRGDRRPLRPPRRDRRRLASRRSSASARRRRTT